MSRVTVPREILDVVKRALALGDTAPKVAKRFNISLQAVREIAAEETRKAEELARARARHAEFLEQHGIKTCHVFL